ELVRVLVEPVSMNGLDRADDARMQRATLLRVQARVCDFLGEGVLEAIELLGAVAPLMEVLEALQVTEVFLEGGVRGHRLEEGGGDAAPQDRGGLQEALGSPGWGGDRGEEDTLDRRGDGPCCGGGGRADGLRELLDEKRVPIGPGEDRVGRGVSKGASL